ncbi:MAG: ABC transporter substrate-binding protein [Deltaproteobacteria bacterium]|nr:ABC transporter substrate-binding protein [Deltaproteobacteria bacterium]
MRRLGRRQALVAGAVAALGATGLGGCARRRQDGEITLWFSYGGKNRKVLLDLVDQFHQAQGAVRVHATFQGDYFEGLVKLRTGLFVGASPTLTHVVGEVVPYLSQAGVLEPLEGIGPEVMDDLNPALAQRGTFVGGGDRPLVALPFNRSTPVAYYNVPLFRELKLTPPTTWSELREVARATTVVSGGAKQRWGFECPIDWWFWVALVGQAGGQVIEPDGAVSLGGEAGVRAIELWQQMIHQDGTMKPPPGRDYNAWEATNNDFLAGRVAMIWTSTAFLRYLEENAQFEVGTAPLPKQLRHAVPTGGTFFVMPRGVSSADREAALTFLRWMMAPAQANAWATRTGYMTVSGQGLAQLEKEGYFAAHPNDRVTLDQLAAAQPWPWAPELFRVQREAVQPRLEAAVLLRQDARTTLDAARRSVVSP